MARKRSRGQIKKANRRASKNQGRISVSPKNSKSNIACELGEPGPPKDPVASAITKALKDDPQLKFGNGTPVHRITAMLDRSRKFPELWLQIFLVGPPADIYGLPQLFARAKCNKADSIEEADIVVFGGGPDVDPQLYGETPAPECGRIDVDRDQSDMEAYAKCLKLGIPMVGICRGAQFLHVMNGGKLFQDIDNHHGSHDIYDVSLKQWVKASSVHHQAVIPQGGGGFNLLAFASVSENRVVNDQKRLHGKYTDVEAFFYRNTACLGVQGHPEYAGFAEYSHWFMGKVDQCINTNPDLSFEGGRLRMKKDFIITDVGRESLRVKLAKLEGNS